MRNLKILLLLGTIAFSSDLGPLHQYMKVIATLSTLLFGLTTYAMYRQQDAHRLLGRFTISTGVLFVAIGIITIVLIATDNRTFYDTYSVILLLPVYLNTILSWVYLRKKK